MKKTTMTIEWLLYWLLGWVVYSVKLLLAYCAVWYMLMAFLHNVVEPMVIRVAERLFKLYFLERFEFEREYRSGREDGDLLN